MRGRCGWSAALCVAGASASASAAPASGWFEPDLHLTETLVQTGTDHPLEVVGRKVEVIDPTGKMNKAARDENADIVLRYLDFGGSDPLSNCTDVVLSRGSNWNGGVTITFALRGQRPTNVSVTTAPKVTAFEACIAKRVRAGKIEQPLDKPVTVTYRYMFATNYSAQGLAMYPRQHTRGDVPRKVTAAVYPAAKLAGWKMRTLGTPTERCESGSGRTGWSSSELTSYVTRAQDRARWCFGEHVAWIAEKPVRGDVILRVDASGGVRAEGGGPSELERAWVQCITDGLRGTVPAPRCGETTAIVKVELLP
jgi:hypothetical protein